MLLAIDVGNTNTVLGVYDGQRLLSHWRVETSARRTYDEYGILVLQLFGWSGIDPGKVTAVAVSSVVPPLQFNLERMSERYFKTRPMFVGPGVKTGMPILYDNPREVGADRIVNAVAAYEEALTLTDNGVERAFLTGRRDEAAPVTDGRRAGRPSRSASPAGRDRRAGPGRTRRGWRRPGCGCRV